MKLIRHLLKLFSKLDLKVRKLSINKLRCTLGYLEFTLEYLESTYADFYAVHFHVSLACKRESCSSLGAGDQSRGFAHDKYMVSRRSTLLIPGKGLQ